MMGLTFDDTLHHVSATRRGKAARSDGDCRVIKKTPSRTLAFFLTPTMFTVLSDLFSCLNRRSTTADVLGADAVGKVGKKCIFCNPTREEGFDIVWEVRYLYCCHLSQTDVSVER